MKPTITKEDYLKELNNMKASRLDRIAKQGGIYGKTEPWPTQAAKLALEAFEKRKRKYYGRNRVPTAAYQAMNDFAKANNI